MGEVTRYDRIGVGYAHTRRPDPRLDAAIRGAIGEARSVVNVGAGAGSYEPSTTVLAVEPSAQMIRQRPAGAAPAVRGVAEALPLADGAVDVALAVLTIHHWSDWPRGVAELRRVARRIVVVTWDHRVARSRWLLDSFPEIADVDDPRAVAIDDLVDTLGGTVTVTPWEVPADCRDGFLAAYWARPAAYLDPAVRAGMSVFAQQPPGAVDASLDRLRAELADGTWHARNGHLLDQDTYDAGYRIVTAVSD